MLRFAGFRIRREGKGRNLRGGEGQGDDFAALSTGRQVMEHAVALGCQKRSFGKSRQQICIGMLLSLEAMRQGPHRAQPVIYDFGYFSHLLSASFSLQCCSAKINSVIRSCLRPHLAPALYYYQGTYLWQNLASNENVNSTAGR